jgi:hypothetical protein
MIGYCMKCRVKREMEQEETISKETRRGVKHFVKGLCSECQTRVFITVKAPELPKFEEVSE